MTVDKDKKGTDANETKELICECDTVGFIGTGKCSYYRGKSQCGAAMGNCHSQSKAALMAYIQKIENDLMDCEAIVIKYAMPANWRRPEGEESKKASRHICTLGRGLAQKYLNERGR